MMDFIEYKLTADNLCLGEIVKGGILKPCSRTIRYSSITWALRRHFGDDPSKTEPERIHSCGYLIEENGSNRIEYLIYSPRDRAVELSKAPIQVEYLTNVQARVFIIANDVTRSLPDTFTIRMGAMLSKGFGICTLRKVKEHHNPKPERGLLNTRIPVKHSSLFGVRNILRPKYGYLFEPYSIDSGSYVLSLFEGSEVISPEFLIKRR